MSKTVLQRVEDEKTSLDDKLIALHLFINGEDFMKIIPEQRTLMSTQYKLMDEYSCVLRNRLIVMRKDDK